MKKNPQVAFSTHTTIMDSDNKSTIAIMPKYNSSSNKLFIKLFAELDINISETDFTPSLAYLYSTASNIVDLLIDAYFVSTNPSYPLILGQANASSHPSCYVNIPFPTVYTNNIANPPKRKGVQTKKKYKPVAMKIKPVASQVSEDF